MSQAPPRLGFGFRPGSADTNSLLYYLLATNYATFNSSRPTTPKEEVHVHESFSFLLSLSALSAAEVIECLVAAQKDVACNEKLFSRAAAAYCEPVRKNTGAASHSRVDIAILDF